MELLTGLWLGMPVWVWLSFLFVVLAILAFDLGIMNKEAHEIDTAESLKMQFLSNNASTSQNSVGQALETLGRKQ